MLRGQEAGQRLVLAAKTSVFLCGMRSCLVFVAVINILQPFCEGCGRPGMPALPKPVHKTSQIAWLPVSNDGQPQTDAESRCLKIRTKKGLCYLLWPSKVLLFSLVAERKGLEPSASGVTGRRYNRLNYRSAYSGLPRCEKDIYTAAGSLSIIFLSLQPFFVQACRQTILQNFFCCTKSKCCPAFFGICP